MQVPGAPSIFFLIYLFILLPWLAMRSAARLREVGTPALPREAALRSVLVTQGLLFVLAWLVGRGFDYRFFALPPLGPGDLLAAGAAFAAAMGLRALLRAVRTEEERLNQFVSRLAPQTPREWLYWVLAVIAAGIAEESAYRGVGMAILWYSLDNAWAAALLCAVAFAAAHWVQGWKSGVLIVLMALVLQGLVAFTGTLVLAMVVHAAYDLVAGYLIAREVRLRSR